MELEKSKEQSKEIVNVKTFIEADKENKYIKSIERLKLNYSG